MSTIARHHAAVAISMPRRFRIALAVEEVLRCPMIGRIECSLQVTRAHSSGEFSYNGIFRGAPFNPHRPFHQVTSQ